MKKIEIVQRDRVIKSFLLLQRQLTVESQSSLAVRPGPGPVQEVTSQQAGRHVSSYFSVLGLFRLQKNEEELLFCVPPKPPVNLTASDVCVASLFRCEETTSLSQCGAHQHTACSVWQAFPP
eukprot:scaffold7628_cov253-Ochromonas_danica.AAC.10